MSEPSTRPPRSDGLQTRQRLLAVALRLFAERGFAAASTRAIACAASTNTAAIAYHFGDKAKLYRASLMELTPWMDDDLAALNNPEQDLSELLQQFHCRLFGAGEAGDQARAWRNLWMREMLAPTGLRKQVIQTRIAPLFDALVGRLERDFAARSSVHALSTLAFALLGLSMQSISPCGAQASACTGVADAARLCGYFDALIASEKRRCSGTIKEASMLS